MEAKNKEKYRLLGLNIAYYRRSCGFSQMKFAELIGISRTHMNRIENAECAVSLDVVFNISEALGIPTEKLFQAK